MGVGSFHNVFVEKLRRSVSYEAVHLNAYESMQQAKTRLGWLFG